jgi:hypothetical protein
MSHELNGGAPLDLTDVASTFMAIDGLVSIVRASLSPNVLASGPPSPLRVVDPDITDHPCVASQSAS